MLFLQVTSPIFKVPLISSAKFFYYGNSENLRDSYPELKEFKNFTELKECIELH
jgi:hypothetical protein